MRTLSAPRVPGPAVVHRRFSRFLGRRFVGENLEILGQAAAAFAALKRASPRIRSRGANVFTQWVGDPDALGSAALLAAILEELGAPEVRILAGALGHPQNRLMVRECGIELGHPNRDRIRNGLNCMVDSSPPLGMANTVQVEPEADYLFVADHHTSREEVALRCLRRGVRRVEIALVGLEVGSTSAFLAALRGAFGPLGRLGPRTRAAAALGIYTDTCGLLHSATPLDFLLFEKLTAEADTQRLLRELRDYRLPTDWHGYLAPAFLRVERTGRILFAPVGRVPEVHRDVIAEIADELLRVDGTALAMAIAVTERGLELSVRADSRLLEGAGERVVRVVHFLLDTAFHGVSGYKCQREAPQRVEGGAHLPRGDPRETRLVPAIRGLAGEDAAVAECRSCGRQLIGLLRELGRRAPEELEGLL